jgi:hypothetical protein
MLTNARQPVSFSMPINGSFNHPQILVQCFHGGGGVDAAR